MTFEDVMDMDDLWRAKQRKMEVLAVAQGCVPVNERLLRPGDRFRLFQSGGAENWEDIMTLAPTVYVWDGCDGIGYGHEEMSGRKACFTGEDVVAVVKSNVGAR